MVEVDNSVEASSIRNETTNHLVGESSRQGDRQSAVVTVTETDYSSPNAPSMPGLLNGPIVSVEHGSTVDPAEAYLLPPPCPPTPLVISPEVSAAPLDATMSMMQYYEARMRDHAAAYASAAAGAAWAAAQMAAAAADFAAGNGPPPAHLNYPPPSFHAASFAYWTHQENTSAFHTHFHNGATLMPPYPYMGADQPLLAYSHPHATGTSMASYNPQPLHHMPDHRPQNALSDNDHDSEDDIRHGRKRQPDREVPRHVTTGKVRRQLQSDGDSSSSSSSWFPHHFKGGKRGKKPRSDSTMIGKSAVAALYEWCSRRNHLPSFVLQQDPNTGDFECTMHLENDTVWGFGRGRNKGAAKQDAARKALTALCPGVVFEEAHVSEIHSVDDLAPNLAKQLDISGKRTLSSEESDCEFYGSSQGASLLSDLLFTTIQIDDRIAEPPVFAYEVASLLGQGSTSTRGRFTCTATIHVSGELVEEKGVGGSKREARHIACSRLLCRLFPECETMVQVKEAAEAARARYAARKKPLRRHSLDPVLPADFKESLEAIHKGHCDGGRDGGSVGGDGDAKQRFRQWSRKKQLDTKVELALQQVNERDDEGRWSSCLEDDVGRTVLRRALPEDFYSLKKLLGGTVPSSLWSSQCVTLLLCRAIAAYEDPPLGCAVLSPDFSMTDGRLLRMAKIGNEPHLPKERFVECLRHFASAMDCKLVNPMEFHVRLSLAEAEVLINSSLSTPPKSTRPPRLQSVQEEGNESDSSGDKRSTKRSSKPSKRSRFQ